MPYVSNMSSKSNSELIADSSDESSSVYDMNEESGLIKDKEAFKYAVTNAIKERFSKDRVTVRLL